MRMWSALRRGLFVLVASSMLFACYHPYPTYCQRVWIGPRWGHAGYWRCV